jgi:hypothetical protein
MLVPADGHALFITVRIRFMTIVTRRQPDVSACL